MDKIKLKRLIKSFTTNVALAVAMGTLALTYIPIVIHGQGLWILAACDIVFAVVDTCFAVSDWKKIKSMLEEDTSAQE